MKSIPNLLLAAVMLPFCSAIGNAQLNYSNSLYGATLIYSNSFTGGAVDINGTAPTYINPGAASYGGSLAAAFDVVTNSAANGYYAYQDGTLGAKLNSVLLPFAPVSGYVYTLSAALTFTVTPPASGYGGMGFAKLFPPSNSTVADPRMGGTVGGNPWTLLNMFANGNGALLYASGASQGGLPNLMTALNTPYTINLVLDTTGTHWYTTLYINGTFVKGYTYGSNPSLLSFGYTQTTTTAGAFKWGPMSLFASPMVLTEQPSSASVSAATPFTNTVIVAAATPAYQWYYNSSSNYVGATALANTVDGRIYGTTNNSLVITNTQTSDGGYYFVVATNSLASITSSIASLTVFTNPVITAAYPVAYTNPISLFGGTAVSGTNYSGASPNFSVSVLGGAPLAYQWLTNGVAVVGATNPGFSITNCQLTSPTNFTCVVSNSYGTATNVWSVAYVPPPLPPYPQAALALQPFGYWRLDEWPDDGGNGDDGVLALDSAGGNNGIYTNAYFYAATYSAITDPNETAVYFDAVSAQSAVYGIQGVNFAAPTNTSAAVSVAAWVNDSSTPANNSGIVAKGYLNAEQYVIDISGGKYRFSVNDAAGVIHSAVAAVGPNGTWQHVVGVCNEAAGTGNTNVAIYVNGLLSAKVLIPSGSGLLNSTVPMTIGARSTSATSGYDLQFNGIIDDVAVFNYALTAGQVAQLYASAGNAVSLSFVGTLPPTNAVYLQNTTLTIPATVFGQPTVGYYWTNLTTAATIASGRTTAFANFDVSLNIPNASASLSGDQLELVVTNAISSTNWFVSLFSPAPPVTLSYTNQILYSNYFNGGTWSIGGMPLTAANMLVGGTNTTWNVVSNNPAAGYAAYGDGTLGAMLNSVLLPFTPHPGYIYTLSALLTFTVTPPAGGWGGLGFSTQFPTNYVVDPRVLNNGWALLNMGANGGGALLNADGASRGGTPNLMTALNTPYDIEVVLDTTGPQWSVALYVAGTFVTNYVYAAGNPNIVSFGYTQTTTTAGAFKWNSIALTQVAPGGVPPYTLASLPASATVLADTSLSIPATAFGSAPFGYSWSNTNNATVISSGITNNMAPLGASLNLPDVPSTWNGNTLALTLTNAYGTNITLVLLTVTNSTIIPTNKPAITGFSLVGGANVVINATNGQSGGTYYLLGSTNLAAPLSQWLPLATNVILTNGGPANGFTFTGTNTVPVNIPQEFYILSNTN